MLTVMDTDFAAAVLQGLAQSRKVIPARFFYDDRGSALFDDITGLPEYYLTRAEIALLEQHGPDIAAQVGTGRALIEFGAGSATKTPLLLRAIAASDYVPIDISGDYLVEHLGSIRGDFPDLRVRPIEADFTRPVALPDLAGPALGFFSGSTIGNFDHQRAAELLRSFRQQLGDGASLLIGIDTRKDTQRLEAAYNDAQGVTAAFNLNLLHRINRELDADIPVDHFRHLAFWNDDLGRIEMHLQATRKLRFTVCGRDFAMLDGETIHTENSYKYAPEEARLLARVSGWEPAAQWIDADGNFALYAWTAKPGQMQP